MPTVFITSRATNQILLPTRAAFHKASPFHTSVQAMRSVTTNPVPMPNAPNPNIVPNELPHIIFIMMYDVLRPLPNKP